MDRIGASSKRSTRPRDWSGKGPFKRDNVGRYEEAARDRAPPSGRRLRHGWRRRLDPAGSRHLGQDGHPQRDAPSTRRREAPRRGRQRKARCAPRSAVISGPPSRPPAPSPEIVRMFTHLKGNEDDRSTVVGSTRTAPHAPKPGVARIDGARMEIRNFDGVGARVPGGPTTPRRWTASRRGPPRPAVPRASADPDCAANPEGSRGRSRHPVGGRDCGSRCVRLAPVRPLPRVERAVAEQGD